MQGYILAFQHDDPEQAIQYWDSVNGTNDIENSKFFSTLTDARIACGKLQTQFTDRQVVLLAATKGIQLANTAVTPNVEPST
jgi:hypothetical protein